MPQPTWWDLAAVVALFTLVPWQAAREYRRLVARVGAGDTTARAREYRSTMTWQWGLTGVLGAGWWWADRPFHALGFAIPDGTAFAAGALVTVAGLAFLYAQWRATTRLDDKGLAALRAQMDAVAEFLPRTDHEAALFRALSVTAGVCEEVVYRGYLLWCLGALVPAWAAVAIGAAAFGVVHLYQGPAGAVRTGVVGLAAGALYTGTGSLLWPIILHAAVDLQGGAVARRVLKGST